MSRKHINIFECRHSASSMLYIHFLYKSPTYHHGCPELICQLCSCAVTLLRENTVWCNPLFGDMYFSHTRYYLLLSEVWLCCRVRTSFLYMADEASSQLKQHEMQNITRLEIFFPAHFLCMLCTALGHFDDFGKTLSFSSSSEITVGLPAHWFLWPLCCNMTCYIYS